MLQVNSFCKGRGGGESRFPAQGSCYLSVFSVLVAKRVLYRRPVRRRNSL
uniref:Uncharacterized protein n=1 Tax=Anguilla anguilla TaxID=7936 RepID=A0A0E9QBJ8_ANGAN